MTFVALTIAGSDPSGGAGIQADLKTFHQLGVYGEAVLTLLTVQNTRGVTRVETMSPDLVAQQLEAVLADVPPGAAKTGALGRADVVHAVAEALHGARFPVVVDPVMISKHGAPLLDADAREAIRRELVPRAYLLTPNVPEAEALTGRTIRTVHEARDAARALSDLGAKNVLVKGGHLEGAPIDVLFADGALTELSATRVDTPHTHGTGCTYSAAITALLARGAPLYEACVRSKAWLTEAIRTHPALGGGVGPVNHHAPFER